jgi:putative transposase
VHLIRNSLDYASWKDRKLLAAALGRSTRRPMRRRRWQSWTPSSKALGPEVPHGGRGLAPGLGPRDSVLRLPAPYRRVVYTTNAIESVNARLRKIIKTRGHFPSDDAATKLIWLALRNITAEWGRAGITGRRP